MSKNKDQRPQWFKFWRRNRGMLDVETLSMEARGRIFTNIMRYFDCDDNLLEMSPIEEFAYNILKQNADEALEDFQERSEVNKINGAKGGRPKRKKQEQNIDEW